MLAEVMQFYGQPWSEILEMEVTWFCKFYARVPVIEARRLLPWLPVLSYPHLAGKRDRKHIQDGLNRQAGYERQRRYAVTSAQREDGWAQLRSLGGNPPMNGQTDGESRMDNGE